MKTYWRFYNRTSQLWWQDTTPEDKAVDDLLPLLSQVHSEPTNCGLPEGRWCYPAVVKADIKPPHWSTHAGLPENLWIDDHIMQFMDR